MWVAMVDVLTWAQGAGFLVTWTLAVWVLALGHRDAAARALVGLLFVQGVLAFGNWVIALYDYPVWEALRHVAFAFAILAYAAFGVTLARWPKRYQVALMALAAFASVSLSLLYLADPCLARCVRGTTIHYGPVELVTLGFPLLPAALGLVLAWDAHRARPRVPRQATLLVASALLLGALVQAGTAWGVLATLGWFASPDIEPQWILNAGYGLRVSAGALAGLGALYVLIQSARRREVVTAVLVAVFSVLAFASGALVGMRIAYPQFTLPSGYLGILWQIAPPVLLAYALVRYRLFHVPASRRVSFHAVPAFFLILVASVTLAYAAAGYGLQSAAVVWLLGGGLLSAVFALPIARRAWTRHAVPGTLVYVVLLGGVLAAEYARNQTMATLVGALAVGAVVLLARHAGRGEAAALLDAPLPRRDEAQAWSPDQRRDYYAAYASYAWAAGVLTAQDAQALDRLAKGLGLTEDEQRSLDQAARAGRVGEARGTAEV